MNVLSRCLIVFMLLIAFGWSQGAETTPETASALPSLTVQDGLMSGEIEDLPLEQVLHLLARQIPLEVHYAKAVGAEKVSAKFEKLPLEEGVKELLKDKNYALSYKQPPGGAVLPKTMEIRLATTGAAEVAVLTSPLQVQAGAPEEEGSTSLEELRERALKNPDSAERIAALEELLDKGEPGERIPTFVAALNDANAAVRETALDLITATGNSKATVPMEPILRTAEQDKDRQVRIAAIRTAFKLDQAGATPVLERLAEDPDRAVQWRAKKYLELYAKGIKPRHQQDAQ